jgi:hypothetical protein
MTRNAHSPACARNQRTRQFSMHADRRQRVADGGRTLGSGFAAGRFAGRVPGLPAA